MCDMNHFYTPGNVAHNCLTADFKICLFHPMLVSLKILTSTSGKAVVLKVDDQTYLFNIFEGFQRYALYEKLSLVAIDALFLTSQNSIPGFIGAYLTLRENAQKKLTLVAKFKPELFFTSKRTNLSPNFVLEILSSAFKDNYISVEMFSTGNITNFIISLPEIKGKLHLERIPGHIPRNLYKILIANGFLEFEGKRYESRDFLDPSIILNQICLFFGEIDPASGLDHKTHLLLESVACFICFTKSSWKYFTDRCQSNSPPDWKNFSGVYFVSENTQIEYEAFYNDQKVLNQNDCQYLLPVTASYSTISAISTVDNKAGKEEILNNGDIFTFNKTTGLKLDRKAILCHDSTCYVPQYPCVEFLGTGCAIPSKNRNVSSILYESDKSAVLMDCGEDTLSQIIRLHGNLEVLDKMKLIYISHSHADHVVGIANLLLKISHPILIIAPNEAAEYLNYFGIDFIKKQMSEIPDTFELGEQTVLLSTEFAKSKSEEFYNQNDLSNQSMEKYVHRLIFDEFKISLCGCKHSSTSVSVCIHDTRIKKSFSYSGDTIPSVLFAYISKNVDLMIHEATFLDNQQEEAVDKNHSTDLEANEIFTLSGGKRLLLTHISNRNRIEDLPANSVGDFFRYTFE